MTTPPRPGLTASKRVEWLMKKLALSGALESKEAAAEWGCSRETIRKDLVILESRGMLRRAHGGALPVNYVVHETDVTQRVDHREGKILIAQAALSELAEGSTVFIESGSTTAILAQLIPAHFALTVVTNSLAIASTLMVLPLVTCHMVGGQVRHVTRATTGYWALRELSDIAVDTAVLGTNAVSDTGELSTPDGEEATIKACALSLGTRTIVVADRSKFGLRALHRYGTMAEVSLLVTNASRQDQLLLSLEHSPRETRFV